MEAGSKNQQVPAMDGSSVHVPRDDFSFVDVALVLLRRKWIVTGCLLLAALGAARFIALTPTRYESRAVVRIGRSRAGNDHVSADYRMTRKKEEQDMLLEPGEVLSLRLREQYSPGNALGQEYGAAFLTRAQSDKEADELVTLVAQADTGAQAQAFLARVTAAVIAEHAAQYAPQRAALNGRRASLSRQLQLLDREEKWTADRQSTGVQTAGVESTGAESTGVQTTSLTTVAHENGNDLLPHRDPASISLIEQRIALEREDLRLQIDLANLQVRPTSLVAPATLSAAPSQPRVPFTFAVALILGLFAGAALAFAVEFALQVKRSLKSEG